MAHPTRDEVASLARQAGLELSPAHLDELVDAYGHLRRMIDRIPAAHARTDEPAHVFAPQAVVGGSG